MAAVEGVEEDQWKTLILQQLRRKNARQEKPFSLVFEKLTLFSSTIQRLTSVSDDFEPDFADEIAPSPETPSRARRAPGKLSDSDSLEAPLSLDSSSEGLSSSSSSSSSSVVLPATPKLSSEGPDEGSAASPLTAKKTLMRMFDVRKLKREKLELHMKILDGERRIAEEKEHTEKYKQELFIEREAVERLRRLAEQQEERIKELTETTSVLKEERVNIVRQLESERENAAKAVAENNKLLELLLREKAKIVEMMNDALQINDEINLRHAKQTLSNEGKNLVQKARAAIASSSSQEDVFDSIAGRSINLSCSVPGGVKRRVAHSSGQSVYSVCHFPGGSQLATGGENSLINVWDSQTATHLYSLGSSGAGTITKIDANDELVVASSTDRTARVWKINGRRQLHTLSGHTDHVLSCCISFEGSRLLTGSADRSIRVWDVTNGNCLNNIQCGTTVRDIAQARDGSVTVTANQNNTLGVWDLRIRKNIQSLDIHSKPVTSVSLSPDGDRIVTCSLDNSLKVLDLRNMDTIFTLQDRSYATSCSTSRVAFSSDGRFVVAPSVTGSLVFWDLQSLTPSGQPKTSSLSGPSSGDAKYLAVSWNHVFNQVCSVDRQGSLTFWE